MIVETTRGATIVGAGELSDAILAQALDWAPVLVAADGGADSALKYGRMPDSVIGDLDSLSPAARAAVPSSRIHHLAEQETTDFDKCLRSVRAPLVLAVGFTGARLDHGLAALAGLVRHGARADAGPVLMLGPEDVTFLCPPHLVLDIGLGTRVSLFPFGPVRAQSRGLRWPLDGLDFAPWDRIGTSNEASDHKVEISVRGPMLAILPRDCLAAAVSALAPGVRQPVRGG